MNSSLKSLPAAIICIVFATNSWANITQTQKGIAVYQFVSGFENYEIPNDSNLITLGSNGHSKAIYRFYLPPEFGSHAISNLTVTVTGTGNIDYLSIGSIITSEIVNTLTFTINNPSDLFGNILDSVSGKYLDIQIDTTRTYTLQSISVGFSYSGCSEDTVTHFLEAYTAYLNIKYSSEMIYQRWDQNAFQTSELMFWLGWTKALGTMSMSAFSPTVGGLVSWGVGKIPWFSAVSMAQISEDWVLFDGGYFGRYYKETCKQNINNKCVQVSTSCMSLALLWKQGFDTLDGAAIATTISDLQAEVTALEGELNTTVYNGDLSGLSNLYSVYATRGSGAPASGQKGDLMAEVMMRSFAPLIAYNFSQTQSPVARTDSFIYTLKHTLSLQMIAAFFNPDINGDGIVDFKDFAQLARNWLATDCSANNYWCGKCDVDYSTTVDFADLRVIAKNWLNHIPLDLDMVWVYINDPGVSGHEGFSGYMSKYETTNAQYCQFLNDANASGDITRSGNDAIGASGSNSGTDFVGQPYYDGDGLGSTYNNAINGGAARIHYSSGAFRVDPGFENHPVTYVSWYGATAFCNYYGYRLPTEWEWQAVADYDGTFVYGCGTTITNSMANYDATHPYGTTAVGSFGTYGYGMCDMAGNVWEWTSSDYDSSRKVFRGGNWIYAGVDCSVSFRYSYSPPWFAYYGSGFRACR